MRKKFRFDQTRRARSSRVIFLQAHKVVSGTCNHEVTFRHLLEAFDGEHFAPVQQQLLQQQLLQQCCINLVCQTQFINGVNRPDPTDHKYLKVKRVKFNGKNYEAATTFKMLLIAQFLFFVINPVKSI